MVISYFFTWVYYLWYYIKMNQDKIVLDLCGGTGAWSRPYMQNSYDVRIITLPDYDVNETVFSKDSIEFRGKKMMRVEKKNVYNILSTPPYTIFSITHNNTTTKEKKTCI